MRERCAAQVADHEPRLPVLMKSHDPVATRGHQLSFSTLRFFFVAAGFAGASGSGRPT